MAYMIDACLEHGTPSLKLIDVTTGEERLHWQGNASPDSEDWRMLFKRLVLLSCADRMTLTQRKVDPSFGNECLECSDCVDQAFELMPLKRVQHRS